MIEIDNKTALLLFAAIAGGEVVGSGGAVTINDLMRDDNPIKKIVQLEIQVDNMREIIINRIAEHKADLAALEERISQADEDLSARIDRLDARKVDRVTP